VSLEGVRARLGRAAVVLDFDGTLAPIVDRPEDARPLAETADVLAALAGRTAVVAVVTGRPEAFVRRWLPDPSIEVVGLYGLEGAPPVDPAVRAAVAGLAEGEPGVHLEDKGASIALHTRVAPDPSGAIARLRPPLEAVASGAGLQLLEGKLVLELAPRGGGKGQAVQNLCAQGAIEAVLYAGDDIADLDAFLVLGTLPLAADGACRIAVLGSGTPEELVLAADIVVPGPEALLVLLRGL
jgi:trehalose 6-phosphate phosphatase